MNSKMDAGRTSFTESILLEPWSYINQLPGRQLITKFTHAFNYWLKIPNDKFLAVKDITQGMFDATILLDDISDNSELRRGSPAAHSIYGIPFTIMSANCAILAAADKASGLNHPDAVKICVRGLHVLHRGQCTEIYWRDTYICPSEKEYREMVGQKCGGIFWTLLTLMQLFSENKQDFTKLIDILGFYLQIQNDYCNLCLEYYVGKKGYCEDLTEGKFGFPIIHAIHNQPNDNQIISILRQRTNDPELKRHCVSLLKHFGSFEYTRKVLTELDLQLREETSKLGGNPLLETIFNEVLIWKTGKLVKECNDKSNS